jgi:hypothetical protein
LNRGLLVAAGATYSSAIIAILQRLNGFLQANTTRTGIRTPVSISKVREVMGYLWAYHLFSSDAYLTTYNTEMMALARVPRVDRLSLLTGVMREMIANFIGGSDEIRYRRMLRLPGSLALSHGHVSRAAAGGGLRSLVSNPHTMKLMSLNEDCLKTQRLLIEGRHPDEASRTAAMRLVPPKFLPIQHLVSSCNLALTEDDIRVAKTTLKTITAPTVNMPDIIDEDSEDNNLPFIAGVIDKLRGVQMLSFAPRTKLRVPSIIIGPLTKALKQRHVKGLSVDSIGFMVEDIVVEESDLKSEARIGKVEEPVKKDDKLEEFEGQFKPLELERKKIEEWKEQHRKMMENMERQLSEFKAILKTKADKVEVEKIIHGRYPPTPADKTPETYVNFLREVSSPSNIISHVKIFYPHRSATFLSELFLVLSQWTSLKQLSFFFWENIDFINLAKNLPQPLDSLNIWHSAAPDISMLERASQYFNKKSFKVNFSSMEVGGKDIRQEDRESLLAQFQEINSRKGWPLFLSSY